VVLYGDFNCPWSYLASRRAALLTVGGVEVDWRAVEHDRHSPRAPSGPPGDAVRADGKASRVVRLGAVLDEMQQVLRHLLPGEELPYALAGFAPHTGAAVAAYAEAYRAGVAGPVRTALFEALWLHAFDLDDPCVIHTLLIDTVRSGAASTDPLAAWEYGSGTHHQVGARTQRLLKEWAAEWETDDNHTVPTLVVNEGEVIRGVDAVNWLGAEVMRRGLLFGSAAHPARARTTEPS
jgi:predicted DsbA family dithiol-disulfide isomerase